jgi:hypothetical protein
VVHLLVLPIPGQGPILARNASSGGTRSVASALAVPFFGHDEAWPSSRTAFVGTTVFVIVSANEPL